MGPGLTHQITTQGALHFGQGPTKETGQLSRSRFRYHQKPESFVGTFRGFPF